MQLAIDATYRQSTYVHYYYYYVPTLVLCTHLLKSLPLQKCLLMYERTYVRAGVRAVTVEVVVVVVVLIR